MFVHEYDSTEYATYDECAEALEEWMTIEDVGNCFDVNVYQLLTAYYRRESDKSFLAWFDEKVGHAENLAKDELITEYEDEEEEEE